MATLYPVNYPSSGTQQYTYLYNAWAATQFVNNTGSPIKVTAVEVWCRAGTSGAYAFANTTNSTSGAHTSAASAPPSSLGWKTYTLSTPMEVSAGATFYAGIRGVSGSTYIYINGYQHSTGNAYYNGTAAGGTLNFYPTMGGSAKRVLGFRVTYELSYTPASIWGLSASVSNSGTGQDVTLSWSASNGTNNAISRYDVYWCPGSTFNWSTASGTSVYTNSCTISGLARGQTYCFYVIAIAPYGDVGSNTTTATIVSISNPSVGKPSIWRSGSTLYVSWSGSNGSYNPIQYYYLTIYNSAWSAVFSQNVGGATSYSLTVPRGTSYIAYVTAVGQYSNGDSPDSGWCEVPSITAPTVNSVSLSRSANTLYASWSASNGVDNPIQSYTLTIYNSNWTTIFSANVGNVTSYSLNVDRGTSYIAYVTAHGSQNSSSTPNSSWVEVPTASAPSIYELNMTRSGATVTLNWKATDGQDNPISIIYYTIYDADTWEVLYGRSTYDKVGSFSFEGTRGRSYVTQAQAHGSTAISELAQTSVLLVPEITKPTVTDIAISREGDRLTATWAGVNGDDNAIVSYYVGIRKAGADVNISESNIGMSTSVSYTVERGYDYEIHIVPIGAVMNGETHKTDIINVPLKSIPLIEISDTKVLMNSVKVDFELIDTTDKIDMDSANSIKLFLCAPNSEDYFSYLDSVEISPLKSKGYFYHLEYGKSYKVFAEVICDNGSNNVSSEVFDIAELMGVYLRKNNNWEKVDVYVYKNAEFKNACVYAKNANEWKKFSNIKNREVE